jgi:hypothetical protein
MQQQDSKCTNEELKYSGGGAYFERLAVSRGTNRDSDGLGKMNVGPFIVGTVDAINADDGQESHDFVPTRHELKQLAGYWAEERLAHDHEWFVYQCTGSSEWRWSTFIDRRLNRLAEILGDDAMKEVWDKAIASYRRGCPGLTDEDWRIFTCGTDEEQEAWRQAYRRHLFTSGTEEEQEEWRKEIVGG